MRWFRWCWDTRASAGRRSLVQVLRHWRRAIASASRSWHPPAAFVNCAGRDASAIVRARRIPDTQRQARLPVTRAWRRSTWCACRTYYLPRKPLRFVAPAGQRTMPCRRRDLHRAEPWPSSAWAASVISESSSREDGAQHRGCGARGAQCRLRPRWAEREALHRQHGSSALSPG